MVSAKGKLDSATSGAELRFESALYFAQRNVLLCGGATLLLFVVHRLFVLLKEVNQLAASKEALTKQAEGAAAAYAQLSAVKETQQKQHAEPARTATPAATPVGAPAAMPAGEEKPEGDEEDELSHAKATIEALRERNASLLSERDAATADAEALKRQAKGLSDECMRATCCRAAKLPSCLLRALRRRLGRPWSRTQGEAQMRRAARGACRGRWAAAHTEREPRITSMS